MSIRLDITESEFLMLKDLIRHGSAVFMYRLGDNETSDMKAIRLCRTMIGKWLNFENSRMEGETYIFTFTPRSDLPPLPLFAVGAKRPIRLLGPCSIFPAVQY